MVCSLVVPIFCNICHYFSLWYLALTRVSYNQWNRRSWGYVLHLCVPIDLDVYALCSGVPDHAARWIASFVIEKFAGDDDCES